jgi:cellulose synthase operon protein C
VKNMLKKTLIALSVTLVISCSQKTSEDHIVKAQEYISKNNTAAAIVELKNAVQLEPKSGAARFELGKVYLLTKQFDSAEKELNRALEYGYNASEVIPFLSQSYQRTGAYVALSKIDQTQDGLSNEEEAQVGYLKLLSLVKLAKMEEAQKLISEVANLETDSIYKGLTLAYGPVIEEDYQTALDAVVLLRAKAPDNEEVLKLQGQLYLQLKNVTEATQVYRDYLAIYPDDSQMLFVLSNLLMEQGNNLEAEPYVDSMLKINAENAQLNRLKAIIRASEKDYANGQLFAEKAINNGSADPVLRLIAGYSAYEQQNYEKAHVHLSYIASSLPDNHPALKILAAAQLKLGLSMEATDVLERLNKLSEQDAPLLAQTGYELIRAGHLNAAKEIVEKSSEISRSAEDLTRLGVLQLSLNDVQGIINLEQAYEQAPEMMNTKVTLATAYMATNQLDKALQLSQDWKQSSPEDDKAFMLAGEVYLKQKDYSAAKQQFEQALSLKKNNLMASMALINLEFIQNNVDQGKEKLDKLLKDNPTFAPALAANYLLKKKNDKSQEGLQPAVNALKANPDNNEVRLLLARMYLSERDNNKVLDLIKTIDPVKEGPGPFWSIKGQALLRSNSVSEAEQHYDLWLSKTPNDKQALLGKLLLLDSQNKFAEGLSLTDKALKESDDVQMAILRTHFLLMSQDYANAKKAYDKLPEQSYQLPLVQGFKARLLLADNNASDALPNAKIAYEAAPNNRNLVLLLVCLEKLDQKQQGVDLLTEHVSKYPQDIAAKMLLAERQLASDNDGAISNYEAALKINPDNFVVLNNLAYLYMQQDKMPLAKKHATRAVELQPENSAALDTLAQILVKQGQNDEALKYYERAVTDKMDNEEIYLNYVEALLVAKQQKLASRKLEQRQMKLPESIVRVAELKTKYGI